MLPRKVVHPAGETADCPLHHEPVEGHIDRRAVTQFQEVGRREDRPAALGLHRGQDSRVD